MDQLGRLKLLSEGMDLEPAEETDGLSGRSRPGQVCRDAIFVNPAVLPNGRRISLLKSAQTSACERNCFYCPFRSGRDFRRASLSPDEMASAFMSLQRAGIVQGLFLSSGIAGGGVRTQDSLLATAEILRQRYHYQGYIHLKLMPGAQAAQIERAMQLSDRVSVNLEAPTEARLAKLAPRKLFLQELLQPLQSVEQIRRTQPEHLGWKGRWPSMTTQFVVGAAGETDLELLTTTAALHDQLHLGRAYFSAFRPIEGTPFENLPGESLQRELRLYQASFLLRDYHFNLEELPFQGSGSLPQHTDPKTAWAQDHLAEQPVEINLASPEELLRVPGIGPRSVQAILNARRSRHLRDLESLHRIGVNPGRAAPFILLDGHRPARQLTLGLPENMKGSAYDQPRADSSQNLTAQYHHQ